MSYDTVSPLCFELTITVFVARGFGESKEILLEQAPPNILELSNAPVVADPRAFPWRLRWVKSW
jgi:hypothetical protein